MKCQPKCQKCEQNVFLYVMLIKAIIPHWIKKWYFAGCVFSR